MDSKKGLFLLGLPLVGGLLLVAAMLLLRAPAPEPKVEARKKTPNPAVGQPTATPYVPRTIPKLAPAEDVTRAADEARLRGTYDNYRAAVATGNTAAKDSLEKALRREPELAIRFAEQELAGARTTAEREMAQKTLDALRRFP